jgi:subtilase family serine protease
LTYDGSGQTIAIVDAFDHPSIASDLSTFDRAEGLPDPPSFRKVALGAATTDPGWAGEIALDVEWAHALAPRANLLLVEAASDGDADLAAAVDYARTQDGVVVVSMSFGGDEFSGQAAYDSHFSTPAGHVGGSGRPGGITFVAAAGDAGAGAEWPASSACVLGVGGTVLTTDGAGNYVGESGWSHGGGGLSLYTPEPAWQQAVQSSGKRATPDVSYDASLSTGFLVYNSVPDASGHRGWLIFGGTSAGAPQWAALVALADQGRALAGKGSLANAQSALYALPAADFHDVTTGSNGFPATVGYDLVTGRGSPRADLVVPALVAANGTSAAAVPGPNGPGGRSRHTALGVEAAGQPDALVAAALRAPEGKASAPPPTRPAPPTRDEPAAFDGALWSGLAALHARLALRGVSADLLSGGSAEPESAWPGDLAAGACWGA